MEHFAIRLSATRGIGIFFGRSGIRNEETCRGRRRRSKHKSNFDLDALNDVGLNNQEKNKLIDKLLSEDVENLWELGDEIRMLIMSGIAAAFDLAINNPGGMVALVEAVEVYGKANEEYKAVREATGLGSSRWGTRMVAEELEAA